MIPMEILILITLVIVCVAFITVPFLSSLLKSAISVGFVLINSIITSYLSIIALSGGSLEFLFQGGALFGTIPVRIDALSAWFILIINFTCIMGGIYGIGYMKAYKDEKWNLSVHWISFVIFHASMLWVCLLQNTLAFLVAWEIMSLSSLILVIFDHSKTTVLRAGMNYLVQMHIGVALLTLAFIWVNFSEGSYDFQAIGSFFAHNRPFWVFFILFAGFGIKAGFIPLHSWLPHAHPAAPSHVSGVMSGVIVKMGIYGIFRTLTYLQTDLLLIGEIVLSISTITAVYGILNASVNRDFKRMLAFCTIENIGIIGMGIGIGMVGKAIDNQFLMLAGYSGALIHVLNHSLFKSLLFFTAGNIYQKTHTRNVEHLGGLIKQMPVTAIFFLIGALAIGGLPPFNGFISEFLIYSGLIDGIKSENVQFSSLMILSLLSLAFVGGLSIIAFTKTFGIAFLGSPRMKLKHEPDEVSPVMRVPLFIIVSIMLIIGLFPAVILRILYPVFDALGAKDSFAVTFGSSVGLLTSVGWVSLSFIFLFLIVYQIKRTVTAKLPVETGSTWGCGYVASKPSMQYTGKSYTKSLAKLFSLITSERKKYREIEPLTIFPSVRSFHSYYHEFIEINIIRHITNGLVRFINVFTFIHNGRVQAYILYGFFFIIAIIAATLLNLL
jgi:formate hydrogenlyase subunit 3/multisubunit Na+/H+ antiporter MnhD subunit